MFLTVPALPGVFASFLVFSEMKICRKGVKSKKRHAVSTLASIHYMHSNLFNLSVQFIYFGIL